MTLAPQTLDLLLLEFHLSVAWKGLRRIGAELSHPFAQHVLVDVQIARSLSWTAPVSVDEPGLSLDWT